MFERAKIYHLKVHISHKKVRQEAKSDHPLFRPANSCGVISFQARTLALLDLSRHATLSSEYCLTKQAVFKTVTAACLKKKKTGFTLLLTAEKCLLLCFLARYHRRPDCLNLLLFVQARFFSSQAASLFLRVSFSLLTKSERDCSQSTSFFH